MTKIRIERRKAPRVKKAFPFTIRSEEGQITTQTKNISVSGAYCHLDKYLPLMTKLSISVGLPDSEKNVHCEGVVVRVEEAVPTGYNVAIFFSDMPEQDRQRLNRYLQRHISLDA